MKSELPAEPTAADFGVFLTADCECGHLMGTE
jgi:hypothetical protein